LDWKQLDKLEKIDEIIELSHSQIVAIFKHSTSCGISRMVLRAFERDLKGQDLSNMSLYLLDLLAYRAISNEVSHRFNVIHESPQLILIQNGTAFFDSSHADIKASSLELT